MIRSTICRVTHCAAPASSDGLCPTHRGRQRIGAWPTPVPGHPTRPGRPRQGAPECAAAGCAMQVTVPGATCGLHRVTMIEQ